MKIGYVRVSTEDQNTARQEALMERLAVDELFLDRMSGKSCHRPELQRMMAFVRKGDTVIVESISRFARNTRDLLDLVEQLTEKGVEFVSKKEAIDTTTPTGKFMLTVFGAVAELEREGIAIAKAQGKYKGRKPIQHPEFEQVLHQWQRGEITASIQTLLLFWNYQFIMAQPHEYPVSEKEALSMSYYAQPSPKPVPRQHRIQRRFDGTRPTCDVVRRLVTAHIP